MKCIYCLCLFCGLFNFFSLHCQSYFSTGSNPEPELLWEAGIAAGAINCLTDIGGKAGIGKKFIKDINWNKTQICGGFFVSATWQSRVAVRLNVNFGQVSGSDDVLKNETGAAKNRYLRNLQFKTTIAELSLLTELHLLTIIDKNREPPLFSPYFATGFGIFHYNPQAFINNVWVDLRPLHTEGEGFKEYPDRKEYKVFSWCVPVGAGVKYDASGLINFRVEISYRFTGTDYLDDVSKKFIDPALFSNYLAPAQSALAIKLADRSAELAGGVINNVNNIRGNNSNKDSYFSLTATISIALGRSARR